MAVTIPFVREMAFAYGEAQQVSPLIRRMVANNPGPFTFYGTGVYIVGAGDSVAMIDPGPAGHAHQDDLKRALDGRRLTHIFVTHGHMDHSPAARPLAEATGAVIHASGLPFSAVESDVRMEAGDDDGFKPDVALADGDVIAGDGWTIEAVFTPGHTSHHMAYALHEENALFPGDHIMGWSTTVISPPDGDMDDYLRSLEKVRARGFDVLWPTHGPPIRAPQAFIDAYVAHRLAREDQILAQLRQGRTTIKEMVPVMYADVDPRLHPAACHSVLAHMIRLVKVGAVRADGAPSIDARYAAA
ncbi:MAG: MBL fold metallo-hydrolase [Hyphomonadaceae bacterium]|nr:MBL fold metallo-hydrolase [Hyphomonadaceae bacterium]